MMVASLLRAPNSAGANVLHPRAGLMPMLTMNGSMDASCRCAAVRVRPGRRRRRINRRVLCRA